MAAVLHLVTDTAEVLASLRRSLAGPEWVGAETVITAPLPPGGTERTQTRAMLEPELPVPEPDAAAIVATSGSTGHPRGVVLSRTALLASAHATAARLGGHGTWVLTLPAHYVAGLMVLVRAIAGGRSVYPVGGRLAELPSLVERELSATEGPYYTALVPTQLSRALADPALNQALTRFDAVLLGGAAADPSLLQRAAAGGVRVVTTYGMSETCGGCVYDGLPLDGVSVSTDDEGRISVGGPMLFSGYRLDPTTTAETLIDGRLRTRDRGQFTDGLLTVLGRLDDMVISGGMNVDLAAVERAVRSWASTEAAVVGVPHPEWGAEVVAVVETGHHLSLSALRERLSAELPHYALPRRLVLRTLPRTSGGKIDRRRLVADLSHVAEDDLNAADRSASEPAESR